MTTIDMAAVIEAAARASFEVDAGWKWDELSPMLKSAWRNDVSATAKAAAAETERQLRAGTDYASGDPMRP